MKPGIVISFLLLSAFVAAYVGPVTNLPVTGYWAMEGTLVRHPFIDQHDSLSGQEILELQDENGLSLWFSRYFFKDVCMLRQCRMIKLWLFWDGKGDYLGMHLLDDEPLTKSDHTKFSEADYKKLVGILRDTQSILRDLSPYDLEIEIESNEPDQIDAYSSATLPALSEVVVQDAVYTCHTLWHTVYGHTADAIYDILLQRTTLTYLEHLLGHGNPGYASLAIRLTAKRPEYHETFYPLIVDLIRSENKELSEQALAYFQPGIVKDFQVQRKLADVIPFLSPHKRNEIIWKFIAVNRTEPDVVVQLFDLFENKEIGVGSLNLLFQLVKPEYLSDQRITAILDRLATSENAYIRNLTNNQFKHN